MKETLIGIINSEKNKGYSSSATSLVNASTHTENIIFDLSKDSMKDVKAKVKDALAHQSNLKIISAGDMGIDIFNDLLRDSDIKNKENKIQFILNSDKYYANDLDMKKITLIMPNVAINEFKENNPDLKITSYPADFVATPSMEELQNRAQTFRKDNRAVSEMIRKINRNAKLSMFVGGRVSDGLGGWKENTPEIFERAAKDYMDAINGDNGVVVFHGLRSFTNAKGENDFEPVEKFYETVKSLLKENQAVVFLTKSDDGKGDDGKYKRSPLFKVIAKEKSGEIFEEDTKMVVNSPAGEYYFVLNEAIEERKFMLATGEQMNFSPEATEMGAPLSDIFFYNWELTVPSNIATQNDILKYYRETGKLPMNATKAFEKLLSDEERLKLATLSQARNR
ncbi:MAG: hypothetical protein ACI4N3_00150 [Alphaproteobacteria bacterium]